MQHAVAQLHPVQQGRGVLPEQAAVQGAQAEAVAARGAVGPGAGVRRLGCSAGLRLAGGRLPRRGCQGLRGPDCGAGFRLAEQVVRAVEALPNQAEQLPDAVVQVVAVQGFRAGQPHQLQVPQALQAVALAVRLRVQGRVAEFRARLDVEQEQQAVHVAQGLQAELLGQLLVGTVVELVLGDFAQVADGFVADQFDALAQGVLQVFGNGEGVLVAVVVQAVEQALVGGG